MPALALFRTDYEAFCEQKGPEPAGRRQALLVPRLLVNPSLQTVLVLRVANESHRATWWFWRLVLLRFFSACDWIGPYEAGPGLLMPHPMGIVIGPAIKLGANVTISHNVSIGGDAYGRAPVLGDRVHVYPGSVIIGNVRIGDGSVVGANSFVTKDVPANSVVKRGVVEPMRESSFSRAVEG